MRLSWPFLRLGPMSVRFVIRVLRLSNLVKSSLQDFGGCFSARFNGGSPDGGIFDGGSFSGSSLKKSGHLLEWTCYDFFLPGYIM